MATVEKLEYDGVLIKVAHEGLLGMRELPSRSIYLTDRCHEWMENFLPELPAHDDVVLTPELQLMARFRQFLRGDSLDFPTQLNFLRHASGLVWELKTADVRLFGAFNKLDCFIAERGLTKKQLLGPPNLYNGVAGEVERALNSLELDTPKFIQGGDLRNVISS